MDPWNPAQYDKFKSERSQPGRDLIALVWPRPGQRVLDLGCGTGELTHELHVHSLAGETLGIDSSERMLAAAQSRRGNGLRFQRGDILKLPGEPKYDVIFSNAALQWLPDHRRLFAALAERLNPRGQLAVQVPAMEDHPAHTTAKEVARQPAFARLLDGYEHQLDVLTAEQYAQLLFQLGFVRQNVRQQVYPHTLAGPEAVIDWIKGTLLTAYQQRLEPPAYEDFLAEYSQRLLARLPDVRPFFYPYNRILVWGQLA